jgi:hypothetical protein
VGVVRRELRREAAESVPGPTFQAIPTALDVLPIENQCSYSSGDVWTPAAVAARRPFPLDMTG